MLTLVYVLFTIVCIFLIITVLLQPGKSGGLGAAFGGGDNTVFGSSGGTPVFRKMTTGAAVCFMLLRLLLAYMSLDKSVTAQKDGKAQETTTKSRGLDFSQYGQESELQIPMPGVIQNQAPENNTVPANNTAPANTQPTPTPAP